jgi:hypothetical protein
MSEEIHYIDCCEHGQQEATFVCQHIVETLKDGKARGFWWSSEQDVKRPDAWCHECNDKVKATDWEWTEENAEFANIQLLCGKCYDNAKELSFAKKSLKSLLTKTWNAIIYPTGKLSLTTNVILKK